LLDTVLVWRRMEFDELDIRLAIRHPEKGKRCFHVIESDHPIQPRPFQCSFPLQFKSSRWLGEHSEPQPDLVLLRRREDFYAGADPGPGDVLLVVEVADTSLAYDRDVKMPLYARAGIPESWLARARCAREPRTRQVVSPNWVSRACRPELPGKRRETENAK